MQTAFFELTDSILEVQRLNPPVFQLHKGSRILPCDPEMHWSGQCLLSITVENVTFVGDLCGRIGLFLLLGKMPEINFSYPLV